MTSTVAKMNAPTRICDLKPKDVSGRIALKLLRFNIRKGHVFYTVMDKNKESAVLIFWASEAYVADQLPKGEWKIFDALDARSKYAPHGQEAPAGVDLYFNPQNSKVEGVEVARPKMPSIELLGCSEYADGHPILKANNEYKFKSGEIRFVEVNAALLEPLKYGYLMYVQPGLSLLEQGLQVMPIHLSSQTGHIRVPLFNANKGQVDVPRHCLIGTLHLVSVPRIKFTTVEVDDDDDEGPHSDPEIHIIDSDKESDDYEGDMQVLMAEADAQRLNPVVPVKKPPRKRQIKPKDPSAPKRQAKET